ncbi:hypothetical protein HK096_000289, partial [Nowakowskiella sp. JEL0078]
GNAEMLMGVGSRILIAINAGTCFLGALSYIGSATNLLVRNVAVDNGVMMPGFVGYLGWSFVILLPLFVLDTL